MKYWKFLFALTLVPWMISASPKDPDCSEAWAMPMTFAQLKNAGITNNEKIDFPKTKTTRLASERMGKDLYRQVYYVRFTELSGKVIEAIAVHDASQEDCSESGVEVFVVSEHFNAERK